MSTPPPTSILILGLDFSWTATHRANTIDPAVLRANVQRGIDALARVPGLHTETLFVNPDDGADNTCEAIAKKLQTGSARGGEWDGVIVGWGMRGVADTSELFERVVNRVKDEKPTVRLMFTLPQPDHLEAIRRNFPGVGEGVVV